MSVLAKLRKQAHGEHLDDLEFSIEAIDAAAGKSVLGTIENYRFNTGDMMRDWQAECIERLRKLEKDGE